MTEFASLCRFRLRSLVPLILIVSALPIAPFSLRALNRAVLGVHQNVSYLPSSDIRRTRREFRTEPIDTLRHFAPRWVFIGDSMLGTRVHPKLLGELSEDGTRKVWSLMHAASGPSFWYLSFKNHLVASGVRPRVTFFVFRDTNLTDTLFCLHTRSAMRWTRPRTSESRSSTSSWRHANAAPGGASIASSTRPTKSIPRTPGCTRPSGAGTRCGNIRSPRGSRSSN